MIDFNRAVSSCLPGPFNRLARMTGVSVMVVLLLAGCSPEYDWRRVSVADGAVVAMLPAKPHEANRDLTFEGHDVRFTLASARVADVMYTVGVASLPSSLQEDEAARQRFFEQTRASLYRNLGQRPPSPASEEQRYVISGEVNDEPVQAHVMAWMTSNILVEGIILGEPEKIPLDQAEEFFRELAPDQQP
ncbi:MAG TPA: hypothetical protein VK104_09080 [Burkholderiaceae bacterium]|nr:hypothetical protein [Burkholderiaceae bacterium]